MKQPNIVFLFADDQRFDTIHALGNVQIITPNLDKLVQCGTTFTHAHIQGGTSGAICMPSRAMLHSGRNLFELDGQGQSIPEEHTLMGEVFQKHGYETFGTGKWHNGSRAYARSFTTGDNIFFGGMHDHWCVPVHSFSADGNYHNKVRKTYDWKNKNKVETCIADKINVGEHSTDFLANGLLSFLDQKHDKPFFAYTAFLAPHDPRTMPDEFRAMYNPEEIDLPPNFMAYHPVDYGNIDCRDELLAPYPRTKEDTKEQIAEYYAMITHLDYQVGRVLDKLDEIGERENTIIIYAADNGLAVGQHGLFGKQSMYEHSVRVPMIFCGKGISADQKRDQLVYISDIFPTLCDLLGFEIPDSVTTESFAKVIADDSEQTRESLYFAYTDKIRAVTKDGYKYMEHHHNGVQTGALYDLENDPYELANLYQNSDYTDKVLELQSLMSEKGRQSGEMQTIYGQNYWNNN